MDETNEEARDLRAAKLLRDIGADLVQFALRRGLSRDDAQDIAAEVATIVHRRRFRDSDSPPEMETREQMLGYCITVARHAIARRAKRNMKREERELLYMVQVSAAGSEWMDPEVAFQVRVLEEAHERAVAALSRRCREAMYLSLELGMSLEEVAAAMGISEDAVKKLRYRALRRIRAELQRDHDLPGGRANRPPRNQIKRDTLQ